MSARAKLSVAGKMQRFVVRQPFVTMATSDLRGNPHVSPKVVLNAEEDCIYLIDHFLGATYRNVKKNNNVALASFSVNKMTGFFIYGTAICLKKGKSFDARIEELNRRQTKFTARQMSNNISKGRKTRNLKMHMLQPRVIYKVKIKKIDKVNAEGTIVREEI